jgi:hypothetical protein
MTSKQIGWSQESNLLWQIGNQIERLIGVSNSTLSTFVPQSRTLTINGVTYDLSANRSWTVAAGLSGTIATGQVAFASATNTISGTNNLFWDAANSRLGIGTSTPATTLNVVASSDGNIVRFNGTRNTSVVFLNDAAGRGMLRVFGNTAATSLAGAYLECTGYEESWVYVTANQASANNKLWRFGNLGIQNYFAIQKLLDNGNIGTTPFIIHSSSSNVSIGSTFVSDSGQRLQVQGDAFIKGSGATSATTGLLVQNSSGNQIFLIRNDGATIFGGPNVGTFLTTDKGQSITTGAGGMFLGYFATGDLAYAGVPSVTLGRPNNRLLNATSGTQIMSSIVGNYSPTSGTGLFIATEIVPTINQTGGANGITRGLYVNPTLTAAADWRSIEWSNSTGWGLYGAGTANNYLGGRLGIGTTTTSTGILSIGANLTGGTTQRIAYIQTTIQSDVTGTAYGIQSAIGTAGTSFTLSDLIHYQSSQASFGGGSVVTSQYGFAVSNNLIGATNNYGFFGNIPSATNRWNLYMAGTADNYLRGKLLINTTTVGTFDLDVNGTARLNGLTAINGGGIANTALAIYANGTGAGNSIFQGLDSSSVQRISFSASGNFLITGATDTGTSSNDSKFRLNYNFAPTSGTRTHDSITLSTTINQTGGANGITRGLYIVPTLTAAADWRAIEVIAGVSVLAPSTTASATLRIPSGTAPTSPVNGDIWFDGTDLKMRIGGVTKTFTLL